MAGISTGLVGDPSDLLPGAASPGEPLRAPFTV